LVAGDLLVPGQRGLRDTQPVALPPDVSALADLDVELLGQRVDHGGPHAVETAGDGVAAPAELPAGVQLGEHQLHRRLALDGVDVGGDAAAVVDNADPAVGQQGHLDPVGVSGQSL